MEIVLCILPSVKYRGIGKIRKFLIPVQEYRKRSKDLIFGCRKKVSSICTVAG